MFSADVERAIRTAIEAHDGQVRKGTERVPYATHPVHVALMLVRLGANTVAVQAGLLHDVVEDCDDWTYERIAEEFGEPVAEVVAELTEDKSMSWAERKQDAIDHAPDLSEEAILVKACDKLHNLRSLARDLEAAEDVEMVWRHFRGGKERTLETARDLIEALSPRVPDGLEADLRDALARLFAAG